MIQKVIAEYIDRQGITANMFAARLNAALSGNSVCECKAITAPTIYSWLRGTTPERVRLRALALYFLYGNHLKALKPEDLDGNTVAKAEADLLQMNAGEFFDKYRNYPGLNTKARFFVYGLFSEAIQMESHSSGETPIGMIGAFRLQKGTANDATIDWGRVWYCFQKRCVFRGAWSSDGVAETNSLMNFTFHMHERGAISSWFRGNYHGFVTMKKTDLKGLHGFECWHGRFYDLDKDRSDYKGCIYAEELSEPIVETFDPCGIRQVVEFISRAERS